MIYRNMVTVMALLMMLLGVAMIVITLASGGGPLAVGVIGGAGFAVLGAIRYTHAARQES